jgi:hypothetical protein
MRYDRISQLSISSAKASGSRHGSAGPSMAIWSRMMARPASTVRA